MVATIVKIQRLSFKKVSYYTVELEGSSPEFDDFQKRMALIPDYKPELIRIFQFIKDIGEIYGAHETQFRHERSAHALPPKYHIIETIPGKFGLRLYCIRLSPNVVILLNGDMKTDHDPEICPNCRKHFNLANKIANKIDEAIIEKSLRVIGNELEMDDDFELYF
ncbi:MAG: hypothetical protein K0R51_2206 [Cytophagaceae bacterium]|nr:hypothetical protein [Cytophagaceae bacterium]